MGKDAEPIFSTFTFGDDEDHYYNEVINKFDVHFVPKRNTIHERACFHRRSQLQGESVEAFVRRLNERAEYCDFGIAKDEHIRDRIVIGILDSEVSQKLQFESVLTLEKAISMTHQFDLIKTQNAGATSMEHEVSAVTRKFKQFKPFEKRHATGGYQQFKGAPNATRDDSCSRCARTHEAGECPATGKRCRKCERIGHFEIVCKTMFRL
jgi:hypothetical protein